MEFKHKSVLLEETVDGLKGKTGWNLCGWNSGRSRTCQEVCSKLSAKGRFIGIDQDQDAIIAASERLSAYGDRFRLFAAIIVTWRMS